MINTRLSLDGFNPAEYAAMATDSTGAYSYLPYNVQRWWFNEVFPNGRIETTIPTSDPEHTPGAYVSQASIWKDAANEKPDIIVAARATTMEDGVDPYQDCQRKAISLGLKLLGFWLPVEKPEQPAVNPAAVGMAPANLVEGTAPNNAESAPAPVAPVEEPKPRRGRKKGVIAATSSDPEPVPAEPVEEKVAEDKVEKEEPHEEIVETVQDTVVTSAEESEEISEPSVEEEPEKVNTMSKEEAEKVVVNYRRYKNITMGELMTTDSGLELLKWFASSERAKKSYPEYAEAAAVLTA